jgi:hypothetical protein
MGLPSLTFTSMDVNGEGEQLRGQGSSLRTRTPPGVDGSSSAPSDKVAEFYSWDNLPPKTFLQECMGAYYGGSGAAMILCPIPEVEAMEMVASIYERDTRSIQSIRAGSGTGSSSGGGAQSVPRPTHMNHQLCQVLLMGAVGSQYLEERVPEDVRQALFASGKWYLDMAFGRDTLDLQRLRANVLVALFLSFVKNFAIKEYLSS